MRQTGLAVGDVPQVGKALRRDGTENNPTGKFLSFGGMMVFLDTMMPQLFHSARDRVMTKAQAQLAGE